MYGYGWDVDYDEFSSFMYRRVEFQFTRKAQHRFRRHENRRRERLRLEKFYPF